MSAVRVLFLADTHLGFDMPARPRIERRRRGHDFLRNFELALAPAREGGADLVCHGGDLFHRSRPPARVVSQAIETIRPVVERGIPFVMVPGNHERSALPLRLLWDLPGVHVFDRPCTHRFAIRGMEVALSGFPFRRRKVRDLFGRLVAASRNDSGGAAGIHLLCMHQAVEGARVGAHDYTFRSGEDIIPGRAIPGGFAAVLSGHIHRAQMLRRDLGGRALAAPVIYAGSTERTAFAERLETKGCALVTLTPGGGGGSLDECRFQRLPARPMERVSIAIDGLTADEVRTRIRRRLSVLDPDAVVRIDLARTNPEPANGAPPAGLDGLPAASLRSLAPPSMNVEIRFTGDIRAGRNA